MSNEEFSDQLPVVEHLLFRSCRSMAAVLAAGRKQIKILPSLGIIHSVLDSLSPTTTFQPLRKGDSYPAALAQG